MDVGSLGDSAQINARVAALEQQTEIRRSLDDSAATIRRQEQRLRQQRASFREVLRQLEEAEQRVDTVHRRVETVTKDLERIGENVRDQERLALNAEQSVSNLSLKRSVIGSRDSFKSKDPVSNGSSRTGQNATEHQQLDDLERGVWKAVQELERKLLEEAERRAAGQQEVLAVLGQGIQQLRSEQARHATDLDEKLRAEQKRFRQRTSESLARHGENENRTALESKLDAITQALTSELRNLAKKSIPESTGNTEASLPDRRRHELPPAPHQSDQQQQHHQQQQQQQQQQQHQQQHQHHQHHQHQHHHQHHQQHHHQQKLLHHEAPKTHQQQTEELHKHSNLHHNHNHSHHSHHSHHSQYNDHHTHNGHHSQQHHNQNVKLHDHSQKKSQWH
eukprot:TRINITY_DN15045_c1_g2_i1.p1 TRINITY_DN15045_c1_g2~~TRINITY_DN15045_c1_g2_i1.p1  ORF type:complete len:392 (+),score=80.82 TRINITY_DN15045_c1_g2_i1:75-1250(+)